MKIAIPIFNFSKEGGIERHTYEFVKAICREHEVHIFSNKINNYDNLKIVWHKVPIINFSVLKHPSFVLFNSIMLKKFQCTAGKFDIIYNNGCGATLVQDIITSASCHKAWMEETKKVGLKKHFFNPMHYWTIGVESFNYRKGHYKKIIAISNFIKRHLVSYYSIPEDKISVIYHGVNLQEFNPINREKYCDEIRMKYSIGKEDKVLLFIGNEFKRKGLKYVFEAMKILNNDKLKLLVVGSGEIEMFKTLAERLGIIKNIVFTGFYNDVSALIASSDIFVFPSTFDAFGLVVLEAMASGIPVIVSSSTGASELVDSGTDGFIISDYKDSGELAEKIKILIENAGLSVKMGQLARKKAEQFSWKTISGKTLEVFENVCRDK